jgi:hypothetical protein
MEHTTGTETDENEFTANLHVIPKELNGKSHTGTSAFAPVIDRTLYYSADTSIHVINAGDEILDNYLAFV